MDAEGMFAKTDIPLHMAPQAIRKARGYRAVIQGCVNYENLSGHYEDNGLR
jgi:hypothetical protein